MHGWFIISANNALHSFGFATSTVSPTSTCTGSSFSVDVGVGFSFHGRTTNPRRGKCIRTSTSAG